MLVIYSFLQSCKLSWRQTDFLNDNCCLHRFQLLQQEEEAKFTILTPSLVMFRWIQSQVILSTHLTSYRRPSSSCRSSRRKSRNLMLMTSLQRSQKVGQKNRTDVETHFGFTCKQVEKLLHLFSIVLKFLHHKVASFLVRSLLFVYLTGRMVDDVSKCFESPALVEIPASLVRQKTRKPAPWPLPTGLHTIFFALMLSYITSLRLIILLPQMYSFKAKFFYRTRVA